MIKNAEYWIKKLRLQSHPEGGFYREIYRSPVEISCDGLPVKYNNSRNTSTSIYFLLKSDDFSSLHRLKSDEIWYYHVGNPVTIYLIDTSGNLEEKHLGPDLDAGQQLQVIIPAGTIFGADIFGDSDFSLVGCVVTPGFDFMDFELLQRNDLLLTYPQHTQLITKLTRV